jgi:hypothetical protein
MNQLGTRILIAAVVAFAGASGANASSAACRQASYVFAKLAVGSLNNYRLTPVGS